MWNLPSRNTVFTKMERKKRKQEQQARKKAARNHEILGMLKADVSANQIAKEFGLSYAGAKNICAKLKCMYVCKTLFKHASLDNYLQLISTRGVTQIKYISTYKLQGK